MLYQTASPLLDACVLGILAQEDMYGYKLTQQIKQYIDISDSTLYPILRRLKKEELLETYDESFQGRNRRNYRITETGQEQLIVYQNEWTVYKASIDVLLKGESTHE